MTHMGPSLADLIRATGEIPGGYVDTVIGPRATTAAVLRVPSQRAWYTSRLLRGARALMGDEA